MNAFPHAMAIGYIRHRYHRRKIERRDAGDHTQRLPDGVEPLDVQSRTLSENSPLRRCGVRGELDDFEPAIDFAERIGEDLAVLSREDLGEVALAPLDELAERK